MIWGMAMVGLGLAVITVGASAPISAILILPAAIVSLFKSL